MTLDNESKLKRQNAFNTKYPRHNDRFVIKNKKDHEKYFFANGEINPNEKIPYSIFTEEPLTSYTMLSSNITPFSWVIRAMSMNHLISYNLLQNKRCKIKPYPGAHVKLTDYYNPEFSEDIGKYLPSYLHTDDLKNNEFLNVLILPQGSINSIQSYGNKVFHYAENQYGEDAIVVAFQLRNALSLGVRIYHDRQAVIANAYILAFPIGKEVDCEIIKLPKSKKHPIFKKAPFEFVRNGRFIR